MVISWRWINNRAIVFLVPLVHVHSGADMLAMLLLVLLSTMPEKTPGEFSLPHVASSCFRLCSPSSSPRARALRCQSDQLCLAAVRCNWFPFSTTQQQRYEKKKKKNVCVSCFGGWWLVNHPLFKRLVGLLTDPAWCSPASSNTMCVH